MFKVNYKDTKKTPYVFIVNFKHISHLCSTASIVNFEQVNAGWEKISCCLDALNYISNYQIFSLKCLHEVLHKITKYLFYSADRRSG